MCSVCDQGEFGADRILGVDGLVTMAARRVICCMSVQNSFARTEWTMKEALGWSVDEETVRRLTHATAARATSNRAERFTASSFAEAIGDLELQIDAGKINTAEGWRDVKVAVFARRPRGEAYAAAQWDDRALPKPSVRSMVAAVEEASLFGTRCKDEAARLQLLDPNQLSVLGDGAEWIWNLAQRHFDGATQLLDIYHGGEYLAAGAKAVFGEGTSEANEATDQGRLRLLEDGYWGVTAWMGDLSSKMPIGGDGAALGSVLNYFAGHQERLNYAVRLRRGQSIGSGMVEGSIKQLLNKRMKQTGARWKTGHVGPFVELGALAFGPEWHAFWCNN
jgi:hypothetical protein